MAVGNTPLEAPVSTPQTQGSAQVRDLVVTLIVNGVPTPVQMQVVSLANADGTLIDMNLQALIREEINLLEAIRREQMITNELMMLANNLSVDLDVEYRNDPNFGSPVSLAGT